MIAPLIKETHWTYSDLKQTPPGWLNELTVAWDELSKQEITIHNRKLRDAQKKRRNGPKFL